MERFRSITVALSSFFAAGLWVSLSIAVASHEVILTFDVGEIAEALLDGPLPIFLMMFLLLDVFLDTAFVGSRNSLLKRKPGVAVPAVVGCLLVYTGSVVVFHLVAGNFGSNISVSPLLTHEKTRQICVIIAISMLILLRTLSYMRVRDESVIDSSHVPISGGR